MRILFIYPNLKAQVGFNYGLAYISALLKQHGHITRLINLNEKLGSPLNLQEIKRTIDQFQPGLIGFSIVTNQYQIAQEVARSIKEYSSVPLVCGGIHPTMAPEEVLASGCFDFICRGEGEYAMLELANRLERQQELTHIPNIWFCQDGQIIKNRLGPLTDLDTLPLKDYELFDFQQMIDAKDGWVGIMTSRGCPFRCSYCFNHKLVEQYQGDLGVSFKELHYLRWHKIDTVIEEIAYLCKNYRNIKVFIFDDDIFTLDKAYLYAFCQEYKRLTNIPFVVNAHVWLFDAEIAAWLKEAGCMMVKFGVESGSERIRREVLNRPMTNADINRAFQTAHQAGLQTSAFVMIGLPYETKADIVQTLQLLAQIEPSRFRWSVFFPYPKTRAFEICQKAGLIDPNKMVRLTNFTEGSCLDFGPEHNLFIQKLAKTFPWYVNTYLSPSPALYAELKTLVEAAHEKAWIEGEKVVLSLDQGVSQVLSMGGIRHYAIKYNPFMAVKIVPDEPDKDPASLS
jgi:radical SAM superfamily enzyme YgiQ (UPF0313 family)